jgi:hypothetical protein
MNMNVYEIFEDYVVNDDVDEMDELYMHHDKYYNVLEDAKDMIDVNVYYHYVFVVVQLFLVLVDVEKVQSISVVKHPSSSSIQINSMQNIFVVEITNR